MKNKFFKSLILMSGILLLIVGCGNISNNEQITKSAKSDSLLAEGIFEQGVITEETTIKVNTTNGERLTTVTLAKDTQFEDASGQPVREVPKLAIEAVQSGLSTFSIGFEDSKGNQLKPTKDVVVEMLAPVGAKDGDEIKINIQNKKTKLSKQEKLTILVVKNGKLVFTISIDSFAPGQNIVMVFNLVQNTGGQ